MSRTRHHGWRGKQRKFGRSWVRTCGYEFQGKEGNGFMSTGRYTKEVCHRKARREGKKEVRDE